MKPILRPLLAALTFCSPLAFAQDAISFTQEQADTGRTFYRDTCQVCHGSTLANGQFGTPLKGSFFQQKWAGKSVGELLQFMYEKMPPDKLMSLTPEQRAQALAYILSRNDLMPGDSPMSGEYESQMELLLPW